MNLGFIQQAILLSAIVVFGGASAAAQQQVRKVHLSAAITLIVLKANKNGDLQIERVARRDDKKLREILVWMKAKGFKARPGKRMLCLEQPPPKPDGRPLLTTGLLTIYGDGMVLVKDGEMVDWEKLAKIPLII